MKMSKTFVLTRTAADNEKWLPYFHELGVEAVSLPLLETKALPFQIEKEYDWIFFTSAKAIHYFAEKYDLAVVNAKIAVIGEKTAEALIRHGRKADFEPSSYVAETFLEEWLPQYSADERILFPRSSLAREVIAKTLREQGYSIEEIDIYETIMPASSSNLFAALTQTKKDFLFLFASPSAWHNFEAICQTRNQSIQAWEYGSIGPITTQAIEASGCSVKYQPADTYTMEAMIQEIMREEKQS